jgi:Protein kinase domain
VDAFVASLYDQLVLTLQDGRHQPDPGTLLGQLLRLLSSGVVLDGCPATCLPFLDRDGCRPHIAPCSHVLATLAFGRCGECPICESELPEQAPPVDAQSLRRSQALRCRRSRLWVLPNIIEDDTLMCKRPISSGAQAHVWLGCWDRGSTLGDASVAVRVEQIRSDAQLREARKLAAVHALASQTSPFVCRVLGQREQLTDHGREFHLVLEYCEATLQGLVAKRIASATSSTGSGHVRPLSVRDLLRIGCGCAAALQALHALYIWHLDVKPDNILITADGQPRLTDFGIAVQAATGISALPAPSTGTPPFAAPEQAAGLCASAAADVYGLGRCLVYAATGGLPDSKDSAEKKRHCSVWPGVHRPLAELLDQMVKKDPKARPSMKRVLEHLKAITVQLHVVRACSRVDKSTPGAM